MSPAKSPNTGHSVFQRLLNHAKTHGENFNFLLLRYGVERLLYRLSISPDADKFILKGASLFLAWSGRSHRVTRDADLLGLGPADAEILINVFKVLCLAVSQDVDGIQFIPGTVKAIPLREEQDYGGIRVTLTGLLHHARIPLQVDIGFGDVVTPAPQEILFPTLLDAPAPRLLACPRETMIAEKLHAMVHLGMLNSRMKDFYDMHVLARDFDYAGNELTNAIKATFKRRNTGIPPEIPPALTEEFGRDDRKITQWKAFVRKGRLGSEAPPLMEVITYLRGFLLPPLAAAAATALIPGHWSAGGPWKSAKPD